MRSLFNFPNEGFLFENPPASSLNETQSAALFGYKPGDKLRYYVKVKDPLTRFSCASLPDARIQPFILSAPWLRYDWSQADVYIHGSYSRELLEKGRVKDTLEIGEAATMDPSSIACTTKFVLGSVDKCKTVTE